MFDDDEAPDSGTVADKAKDAVYGARRDDYGEPGVNHRRTALLWRAYLKGRRIDENPVALDATDVCMLNILQKMSRSMNKITEDTLVDVIGYVLNIDEMRGGPSEQIPEDGRE